MNHFQLETLVKSHVYSKYAYISKSRIRDKPPDLTLVCLSSGGFDIKLFTYIFGCQMGNFRKFHFFQEHFFFFFHAKICDSIYLSCIE